MYNPVIINLEKKPMKHLNTINRRQIQLTYLQDLCSHEKKLCLTVFDFGKLYFRPIVLSRHFFRVFEPLKGITCHSDRKRTNSRLRHDVTD